MSERAFRPPSPSRSPGLLSPAGATTPRQRDAHVSTSSSHRTLSIASYYYDGNHPEWGDSSAMASPSRVSPAQAVSRAADRGDGGTGLSLGEDAQHRPFADWAAGLQFGQCVRAEHGVGDTSIDGVASLLDEAFQLQGSTPHSPAQQFASPLAGPSRAPERQDRHWRAVSSASEGDVGNIHHVASHIPGADTSTTTLNMNFNQSGPQPGDSVSYLGTSRQSSLMMGTDRPTLDDSEDAILTLNPATPSGFSPFATQVVQSPEHVDPSSADYFGGNKKSGAWPVDLEDGDGEQGKLRDAYAGMAPQRSSADMYSRMGISSSADPGGLLRARQSLSRVGKSIRRASRRIVSGEDASQRPAMEGRIRLPDTHDEDFDSNSDDGGDVIAIQQVPRRKPAVTGLRGKSLGLFGPESRIRQTLALLMTQWWIEPLILSMIVFNVVLLVIQSSPNVFEYPRKSGYFDYWVDYALLSVFVVYTLEAIARIIVSGLIINPPPSYQAPRDQAEVEQGFGASTDAETPITQHLRAKTSRSNTLDTFSVLGDTIKSRATGLVRPTHHLDQSQPGAAPVSPNRAHPPHQVAAPRLVTVDSYHQGDANGTPPTLAATTSTPLRAAQRQQSSAPSLWEDKTSKFLEKTRLAPFAEAIRKQRAQAVDYAYLRHSWNRIDFLAIVSFWIAFALSSVHEEMTSAHHIYVFRALSVLRCARLLTVTRGTSVILHSLKTAGPLLVNVAFFTIFAMLLFSIIGVQSFEGNYRRSCVWIGDLQTDPNAPRGQNYTLSQMCAGHFDAITGDKSRAVDANGRPLRLSIKGFICPQGQLCVEAEQNPVNNSQSFDNIFTALLQVIIVISLNGWSTIMYDMMDADYYPACLYFIIGMLVMNLWMANLFVAVITNTFATISAETKQSAFAAERFVEPQPVAHRQEESAARQRRRRVASVYKRVWGYTKWFWLALIVSDLGVQASQASYHRTVSNDRLGLAELYLTIAFDVEIVMRFFSYLLDENDVRGFWAKKRNRFDLFLAVMTSIIQIPAVKHSAAFPWLTVFQLARFYRVIAAVPRMEALLIRVFGSLSGLSNMIMFLLLMVGLASLIAAQLYRGDIPQEADGQVNEINFKQMWNSFLGMYQIFSSENWTTPLFSVLSAESNTAQAVIGAIFVCGWFLFANFIVLQMFIAVIAENFGVAESQKRSQQLELYLRNLEKPQTALIVRILQQLSPYRWLREHNAAKMGETAQDKHPETRAGAQQVLDRIDEKSRTRHSMHGIVSPEAAQGALKIARRFLRLDRPEEQVPLDTMRARQFRQSFSGASMLNLNSGGATTRGLSVYDTTPTSAEAGPSSGASIFRSPLDTEEFGRSTEDTARLFARDRQLRRMRSDLGLISESAPNQAEVNEMHINRLKDDPRMVQARMINTHPSYEKSLWLFSNTNSFRRTCQSVVPCLYGERLFGRKTSRARLRAYQLSILATVAASVIVAGVATPLYRREWYKKHGLRRDSWFSMTEVMLSIIFIAEFFVKVIADGFAFTPNAYLMSPWNALDLFVLLTLLVNVSTELAVIGGVSRFTRALKAFRALRLINLSDLMRRTFAALVAVGGRFIDASVLAILYIVPFAVWGQNLFSGLLFSCTDGSSGILTKGDCVGEYGASPSQWTFLAPRAWQNPTQGSVYSFDDFRSSLLILFEIVSLEGWTNVMATAMSVAGFNQNLQTDTRQINALFFVIYNLIGAVFVLTLFVAVIIESFQTFSGAAYQTTAQRQWIDLKRLISRQRPSKRPKTRPTDRARAWCYDRAVHKHGWWSRLMTVFYLASLVTLATQRYDDTMSAETIRDVIYITLAAIFAVDIFVRLFGLGWRAYRQDMWNLFDLLVVTGTLATSIPLLSPRPSNAANVQVQKIFLVAVAFKLVQKNNALNQLFKTAVSSLPSIASLFLLWLTMFLVWGIMLVEVFGLTAWGINETYNKNFSSLLKSLIFLAMMSTGEGWNSYMHDYTLSSPQCTASDNYLETDCGSQGWAYFLFVGWNVISMYIFLNMFTATVVENFSYVFQLGGKPTLSREQVRNFKKAWAEMDTKRSGYLPKDKFVPFFNRLDGALEVRVYPVHATISALKAKAMTAKPGRRRSIDASSHGSRSPTRVAQKLRLRSPAPRGKDDDSTDQFMWPPAQGEIVVDGVNVSSLKRQLGKLDHAEIRRRKHRIERMYHEACLVSETSGAKGGGVSFTDMLMLVAHYKLIDDEQALSLEELVDRRALRQRVEDRIETERVRGILSRIWLRRRFLAMREARQQYEQGEGPTAFGLSPIPASPASIGIPGIHVDSSMTRPSPRTFDTRDDDDFYVEPMALAAASGHDTSGDRGRSRPALRLHLGNLGGGGSGNDDNGKNVDARLPSPLSPAKVHVLREADWKHDQPGIHLTTTDDDDDNGGDGKRSLTSSPHVRSREDSDRGYAQLSPSPSLQTLEQRASPVIQEIDASAWGALARRVSVDVSRRESDQGRQRASSENNRLFSGSRSLLSGDHSSTSSRHASRASFGINRVRSHDDEQSETTALTAGGGGGEMREVSSLSGRSSTSSFANRPRGSSQTAGDEKTH